MFELKDIFTAAAALVGVIAGAYWTRQTQHGRWLIEQRANAFVKFLELIEVAHAKASDVTTDTTIEPVHRNIRVLEIYQPVMIQARIIRLYLPRAEREEFFTLVREYWALHTDPTLGDSRLLTMSQKLDRIQEIFEQQLSPHFWLRPLKKRLSR